MMSTDTWRNSALRLAAMLAGPCAIALGCWMYLAIMIDDMTTIPGMSSMMMKPQIIDPFQLFGLFLMWAIMMAAMMLPTAAPMVMAYARMQAVDRNAGAGWLPVLMLSAGYVLAWGGFSLGAAILQAGLSGFTFYSPMMMKLLPGPVTGGVLIATGIYQFTPFKQSCLRQCRTPMSFLMTRWRDGNWGGLMMGCRHGLFCVGCCWALMGLLFIAGVMNTAWIIVITLYVLIEKTVPNGQAVSRLVGVGLIGTGLWHLVY